MTSKKYKINNKSRIKSIVSSILIFLFAIVSSAILITVRKKNIIYDERIFYLVSATSEHRESLLEPKKELLKNLGSANVVYKQGDNCHLIVNIYLDFESAEEIKNNLTKYFSEAQVLKVKSKKITRNSIRKIKESLESEKMVKRLYVLTKEYQDLEMNYLAGKISESQFINDLVDVKLELGKLTDQIVSKEDYHQKIRDKVEMFVTKLTNFLAGIDIARSKQNYICNYFVSFYLDYLEFYESL